MLLSVDYDPDYASSPSRPDGSGLVRFGRRGGDHPTVLTLDSLDLMSFSSPSLRARCPLDEMPLKGVFKDEIVGIRYLVDDGDDRSSAQFKRAQFRFESKTDRESFTTAVYGVIPFKPAQSSTRIAASNSSSAPMTASGLSRPPRSRVETPTTTTMTMRGSARTDRFAASFQGHEGRAQGAGANCATPLQTAAAPSTFAPQPTLGTDPLAWPTLPPLPPPISDQTIAPGPSTLFAFDRLQPPPLPPLSRSLYRDPAQAAVSTSRSTMNDYESQRRRRADAATTTLLSRVVSSVDDQPRRRQGEGEGEEGESTAAPVTTSSSSSSETLSTLDDEQFRELFERVLFEDGFEQLVERVYRVVHTTRRD